MRESHRSPRKYNPGASSATFLAEATSDQPVAWSEDGDELTFSIPDADGDFYPDTRVVDATDGSTLATVTGTAE